MFQESGLEDVFIESGLYGSSSFMTLFQGKSYNRGIRGHILIMEAPLRLKWDAFCSWVSKGGGVGVESEGGPILNLVDSVIESYTEQQQQLKGRKRPICSFVTPPPVLRTY